MPRRVFRIEFREQYDHKSEWVDSTSHVLAADAEKAIARLKQVHVSSKFHWADDDGKTRTSTVTALTVTSVTPLCELDIP